ncbi:MAG: DUF2975 domain-containing protein [Anaerovoracaceae bacterium]|jgi:hypothetical protein
MWNSKKSTVLSLVCTRIVMALMVVCAVLLPKLMAYYADHMGNGLEPEEFFVFMAILYACCLPGGAVLICLDRLLSGIRRGDVFVPRNVFYLRTISWCCFAGALLLAIAGRYYLLFLGVAIIAAFIGLILRVVKNVIEEAIVIKTENDFTI